MTRKKDKKKQKKNGLLKRVLKKVRAATEKKPEGPKIVMNADGIPVCPCGSQTLFKGHRRYFKGKEAKMDREYKCPSCGEYINIPS